MLTVSVLVGTFGSAEWKQLAERAEASVTDENETICLHLPEAPLHEVRNRLGEQASGDWLCFLDGDDELGPGYLAAMRRAMNLWNLRRRGDLIDNPLLLSPAVQYVSPSGALSEPLLPNRQQPMAVLNHCVIGTLVPRLLFQQVGGFRGDLASLEDWELFLRCIRAGAKVVDVPEAVYRAYSRARSRNSDQTTYDRIRREHERALLTPAP